MTGLHFTIAALLAPVAFGANYLMYVGTYTNPGDNSQGIYAFKFDSATGQATPLGLAAETANPSFLAIHQNRKYLYAVSEKEAGKVNAYLIDSATGKLKLLNTVDSQGATPCHLNVDKTGTNVLVANYGGGSVAVLPINGDGSLKPASSMVQHTGSNFRPGHTGPHAHSVNLSPDNRFAIVADSALDEVKVYKFDATAGKIVPNEPPAAKMEGGNGPRHFAFHPNGKNAYVLNEAALSITAFKWHAEKGVLKATQTISTLPPDFTGSRDNFSTAEVVVHPSGKFVYGSNRGHDTIGVFRVKGSKLAYVENLPTQGKTPRNFVVDPSGQFLLAENERSASIVVFKIDQKTGKLTPTGATLAVGAPVCIRFLPL